MEELLKSDNMAIAVLAAWVIFLIKDRATERAEKAAILELYRQKVAALDKVSEALRRIRYLLQMDQTGQYEASAITKD